MRILATLITALLLATSAQAEGVLKSLTSLDATRAWQGVGRINLGSSGFCTGTLIAPDLVLTAAHCFFDKSGARTDDSEIEFLAGWQHGRASAYRGAKRSVIHPDYVYKGRGNVDKVSSDLAVIQLDQPIKNPSIRPFNTAVEVGRGQEVQVISYAKNREDSPSIQETCNVLARDPGVYVTSCDVDFGSSGAPIFAIQNGEPVILSVVSAKAEWRSQKVALGVGLDQRLSVLLNEIEYNDGVFRRVDTGASRVALQSGIQPSGALFIKP
ncbi:V8-like Glu-specific endopeptidase [Litoreibacter ascidiaceicola]|uniref:V8-like Glu-specific endopeptidase n=1 Tax=Litoreibacter ascidiaceicola TaxID=1486859 RepID=A0A1M5CLI1_9RHOB|nr:trypsin-like serine protease [Litoreibacter ascidiaceicola]SHF55573.1 V8-like Glu-specific endopeptidase [Litoreibacter ascidiaceicola]